MAVHRIWEGLWSFSERVWLKGDIRVDLWPDCLKSNDIQFTFGLQPPNKWVIPAICKAVVSGRMIHKMTSVDSLFWEQTEHLQIFTGLITIVCKSQGHSVILIRRFSLLFPKQRVSSCVHSFTWKWWLLPSRNINWSIVALLLLRKKKPWLVSSLVHHVSDERGRPLNHGLGQERCGILVIP